MKKNIFTAIVAAIVVVNVNAQDITSESVSSNPADVEYSAKHLGNKWNYEQTVNSKGYYRDVVEDYAGNSTVPTVIKSAAHRGIFMGVVGEYESFDGKDGFGGGLEMGWLGNHWGFSVTGTCTIGHPDRTSMDQAKFKQWNAMGRLYLMPDFLQFCNHHLIFAPYGEFSYKYCRDYQEEAGTTVDKSVDDYGTTTTTTKTLTKLDNRASTMGWAVGLYVGYEIWGTPIRIHASVDYGKQQNLTFVRDMWHNRLKAEVGFSITLRKVQKNHKAIKDLGINEAELPRMW